MMTYLLGGKLGVLKNKSMLENYSYFSFVLNGDTGK